MRGKLIVILEGQNIFDVAMQEYGVADPSILIGDNPELSMSKPLISGSRLLVKSAPTDDHVVKVYKQLSHSPCSGILGQELVNNGDHLDANMGGWSGDIVGLGDGFTFLQGGNNSGRCLTTGLKGGKKYLVSIHVSKFWTSGSGEMVLFALGKDSDGNDGTLFVDSYKELYNPGRYEFELTADDSGHYAFVYAEFGFQGVFGQVSIVEIE
jgi:hypothetical protein